MGKYINPFTDYGFKKIFGQELTKDLLIDFLNDLLEGDRVITRPHLPEQRTTAVPDRCLADYDRLCPADAVGQRRFSAGSETEPCQNSFFFIRLTLALYSQFRRQSKLSNTPVPDSIHRKGYFQRSYRQVQ